MSENDCIIGRKSGTVTTTGGCPPFSKHPNVIWKGWRLSYFFSPAENRYNSIKKCEMLHTSTWKQGWLYRTRQIRCQLRKLLVTLWKMSFSCLLRISHKPSTAIADRIYFRFVLCAERPLTTLLHQNLDLMNSPQSRNEVCGKCGLVVWDTITSDG